MLNFGLSVLESSMKSSKFFLKLLMLRCSTENVSGYSNFEKPILTSEGEKYSVLRGGGGGGWGEGNIVKKEIDIRILVTVREMFIVQQRVEAH